MWRVNSALQGGFPLQQEKASRVEAFFHGANVMSKRCPAVRRVDVTNQFE
jgi:hypothetical protein